MDGRFIASRRARGAGWLALVETRGVLRRLPHKGTHQHANNESTSSAALSKRRMEAIQEALIHRLAGRSRRPATGSRTATMTLRSHESPTASEGTRLIAPPAPNDGSGRALSSAVLSTIHRTERPAATTIYQPKAALAMLDSSRGAKGLQATKSVTRE